MTATTSAPPAWLRPVRGLLAALLVLAGTVAATVTAFLALLASSGCLLACVPAEQPPVASAVLAALAVACLLTGAGLARLLVRTARTPGAVLLWAAGVLTGLGLLLPRV